MILAGDVGGTKVLLALYQVGDAGLMCISKQHFASGDFAAFGDLLQAFIANHPQAAITRVCLGVAGPIVNGDCHTTNLPWSLTCAQIAAQTGASRVVLLNDLQATAWGILNLPDADFIELNPNATAKTQDNIAILAAGTGLGEAIVHWDGAQYHVMPTEGGHCDFAPTNALEIELLLFLLAEHAHVSYERVVSGMGLINIFRFLHHRTGSQYTDEFNAVMAAKDPAAMMSEKALQGGSPLCEQALALFCQAYGAEAGNLALKALSYGGVVLAGGIAAKILPLMQNGVFMQAFQAKGRHSGLVGGFSVRICSNPEVGLLGAAHYLLD